MTAFRPAGPADVDVVVAFWEACGLTRPWNPPAADFARFTGASQATLLLAEDADGLAATVGLGDDGHRAWVYYLAVRADLRGRGLGRAAMAAAEDWARARGAVKLQLMVRADNDAAGAFYAAQGYADGEVRVWERWLDPARIALRAAHG